LIRDATKLQEINGPYELAFDLGCFHGIPKGGKEKYLEQLDRILAFGGFWLMYGFLKSEADQTGTGLAETDIDLISSHLTLLSRRDGFDKRERSSAWFLFQKQ
jgi:hypothetical protein